MILTQGQIVCLTIPANNNSSTINSTGTYITIDIPDGLSYSSSIADQGSYDPVTSIWTIGLLPTLQQRNLQICFTIDDPSEAPMEIRSYIRGNELDQIQSNNVRYDVIDGVTCAEIQGCGTSNYFFSVSDDTGVPQIINHSDNVSLRGGTNINVTSPSPFTFTVDWAADLIDINDVTYNNLAVGDYLQWNGTTWINNTLPTPLFSFDITDSTNTTEISSGETILFEGGGITDVTIAGNTVNISSIETVTSIVDHGLTFTYTDENGNQTTISKDVAETITTFQNLLPTGNIIGVYTNEAGTTYNLRETTTVLTPTATGFTYVSENGTISNVNFPQFSETTTLIQNTIVGHKIGDYTNEVGAIENINETVTTLSNDVLNNTLTYTSEDGTVTIIDYGEFETVTTFTNLVPGHLIGTYSNEDGILFNVNETVTSISFSGTDLTYTDEQGNNTVISLSGLTETVTTLVDNPGSGMFTYTNEDGTTTTVDYGFSETVTTLSDNPATGVFTYTNENGVLTTVNYGAFETDTTFTNLIAGNLIGTYTNESGVTFDVDETITNLVLTGNDLIYTKEDGSTDVINLAGFTETDTSIINLNSTGNTNGIGTYISETGLTYNINETITDLALAGTILTYTKEDGTTDVIDLDGIGETITTLVDTPGTSFTYTSEDGTITTVNYASAETNTAFTNLVAGNLIGTYTNEAGTTFDVDETITTLSIAGTTLTYTKEDGTTDTINLPQGSETITSMNSLITGNLIGNYVAENGTVYAINETVTTIANTVAGHKIFDYTNENGNSIDVNETITTLAIVGTDLNYTKEDGTIDVVPLPTVSETITTLVNNPAGNTFVYTSEDGTQTTVNYGGNETITTMASLITTGNDIGTYTSEDGTVYNMQETITSLSIAGQTITYTKEDGTTDTINLPAGAETITTLVDNGDDTFTYTSEDGTVTTVDYDSGETATVMSGLITTGNTIGTYTNEVGTAFVMQESATNLAIVGTDLVYTGENVTNTIPIASLSGPDETITTITNLNTGNEIGLYTNEAGTTYSIAETVTSVVENGDGTFTYTNEAGGTTSWTGDTDTTITNINVGNNIGIYTNESGTTYNINETITSLTASGFVITYTDETGASNSIDLTQTAATETNLVITTDGNANGVLQSGTANHIADITLLSGDANNLLVTGTDGGVFLNQAGVYANWRLRGNTGSTYLVESTQTANFVGGPGLTTATSTNTADYELEINFLDQPTAGVAQMYQHNTDGSYTWVDSPTGGENIYTHDGTIGTTNQATAGTRTVTGNGQTLLFTGVNNFEIIANQDITTTSVRDTNLSAARNFNIDSTIDTNIVAQGDLNAIGVDSATIGTEGGGNGFLNIITRQTLTGGTATAGQVLSLINPLTGEAEWADAGAAETITTLTDNGSTFTYTSEDGTLTTVNYAAAGGWFSLTDDNATNTIASGNTLTMKGGVGITTDLTAADEITWDLTASLNDLQDVIITNPVSVNDVLTYDGSNWVNGDGGVYTWAAGFDAGSINVPSESTLRFVGGNNITTTHTVLNANPLINDITFDWAANIDDLGDVDTTTTAPTVGQTLEWNGTNWVPATPTITNNFAAASKFGNQTITGTGQKLTWGFQASSGITIAGNNTDITIPADSGVYQVVGYIGVNSFSDTTTGLLSVDVQAIVGTINSTGRATSIPMTSTTNQMPNNTFIAYIDTSGGNAVTFSVDSTFVSGTSSVRANNTRMSITRLD